MKGDASHVRLVAIPLEMSPTVAQLANPNEGAGLHTMSFTHAPGALVSESFVGPVPRTVHGFLDPSDMTRIEGGRRGCEGVSDVAAETTIGVRPFEVAGGLAQTKPIIC